MQAQVQAQVQAQAAMGMCPAAPHPGCSASAAYAPLMAAAPAFAAAPQPFAAPSSFAYRPPMMPIIAARPLFSSMFSLYAFSSGSV